MIISQWHFLQISNYCSGLECEGVDPLLHGGLRGHRGQHAHDPGQQLGRSEAKD